ncbi:MAG TPA: DMT family protein [Gemmatimonadaceae bacterium]|nr:DMT family protein [Gemmatimonadaceae bacterium]
MPIVLRTTLLLVASNLFMTYAWYGHLKTQQHRVWYAAALISWGIALFEYLLQVPANRMGFTVLSLGQLKMLQEVIAIGVFIPFAVLYMKQPLKLDFLWAALCLVGAVYFVFRGQMSPA